MKIVKEKGGVCEGKVRLEFWKGREEVCEMG
jgi:hypothetical protein